VVNNVKSPLHIGSYRIERLLGVGSFATVWLGFDPALGARVAIKVLAENWSHDLRVRERFLDEGRLLWRLDHERLVRVHSVGELSDGRPYIVMAWAEGGSLRDRLAAGSLRVGISLALLREIAAGAAVLHANGIVHRDLTPGNVLFRSLPSEPEPDEFGAGQVLIADLGLAKALAAASGLTARAGTPGFMAPEQDDPLAVVDVRTDVFGLGRLGAMLLCAPAAGRSGASMPLRVGVPPKVADVLRKATAYQAIDRYPDASAFAAALDRAAGTSISGQSTQYFSGARGRRAVAAAITITASVVMAVTGAEPMRQRPAGELRTGADSTGRITVTLPQGWRVKGSGWAGQHGPAGDLEPALVMAPNPDRWLSDAAMPGAFVGLSRGTAAASTPAQFVAGRPHPRCVASPVRTHRQGGVDWVVAEFTSCATGKPVIVEAAAIGPAAAGLVYVEIAPPAGSGSDFVDTLLAGVRVRR
jgi:tRNA A-37 threonylcarbamoyl transferase component Bud32